MKRVTFKTILGAALLLIAACGGGGIASFDPRSESEDPPETGYEATKRAATSTPVFGSVTQSSNRSRNGKSSDIAEVTVGSDLRFTLQVTAGRGGNFSLNSVAHSFRDAIVSDSPLSGRMWRDLSLRLPKSGSIDGVVTFLKAIIDYDPDDHSDWMAFGSWERLIGERDMPGFVAETQFGVFIDGPEFSQAATLPTSSTASYSGKVVEGHYTIHFGDDASEYEIEGLDISPGSRLLDYRYRGDFSATADFAARTISGHVDNVFIQIVLPRDPDNPSVPLDVPTYREVPLRLVFDQTRIGEGGRFTGSNVRLEYEGIDINSSRGSWGSRFSNRDDSSNKPRAIAGTHGSEAVSAGGTEFVFIGAHFGATPDF